MRFARAMPQPRLPRLVVRVAPIAALAALATLPGCFTITPTHCEAGECGVKLTPARKHTPDSIVVIEKGTPPPEGALFIAILTSAKTSQHGCSSEALEGLRGKAAMFGFDGISDVRTFDDGGRSACTGRGYILPLAKP